MRSARANPSKPMFFSTFPWDRQAQPLGPPLDLAASARSIVLLSPGSGRPRRSCSRPGVRPRREGGGSRGEGSCEPEIMHRPWIRALVTWPPAIPSRRSVLAKSGTHSLRRSNVAEVSADFGGINFALNHNHRGLGGPRPCAKRTNGGVWCAHRAPYRAYAASTPFPQHHISSPEHEFFCRRAFFFSG